MATELKNKSALILALLYSADGPGRTAAPIEGITRLEKMLFLLTQETQIQKRLPPDDKFVFEPFKLGPFTPEVYDEVDFLESLGLIKSNVVSTDAPIGTIEEEHFLNDQILTKYQRSEADSLDTSQTRVYSLTDKGKRIAERVFDKLTPEERAYVRDLKGKFNRLSLRQFLRYVYRRHPKFTTRSEIKELLGL